MPSFYQEVVYSLIAAALLLVILVVFIISFAFLFNRRQSQFREEKQAMQEAYQRELLQAQLETQNQTLEYVGRELHDNVGQMLSVAMLQLNGLEEDLAQSSHQLAVGRMVQTIELTIQEVRQLAKALDSSTIRRFGLSESLTHELERIGHTNRYKTELQITGNPYELGAETEIILFRMAQESLNNALKYARAKSITVTTDYRPETFKLVISDDGSGFDLTEITNRKLNTSGSGVHNLYQRAQLLGGTCLIDTKPGAGTRIEINIPYQKKV